MKNLRGVGSTEHRKDNDLFSHTSFIFVSREQCLREILEWWTWGRGNRERHGTWDSSWVGQVQVRSSQQPRIS